MDSLIRDDDLLASAGRYGSLHDALVAVAPAADGAVFPAYRSPAARLEP